MQKKTILIKNKLHLKELNFGEFFVNKIDFID